MKINLARHQALRHGGGRLVVFVVEAGNIFALKHEDLRPMPPSGALPCRPAATEPLPSRGQACAIGIAALQNIHFQHIDIQTKFTLCAAQYSAPAAPLNRDKMMTQSFEETYPRYPFSGLVALALGIARLVARRGAKRRGAKHGAPNGPDGLAAPVQ